MEDLLEHLELEIEWGKNQLDAHARMSCFPQEYKNWLTDKIYNLRDQHYQLNNTLKLEKEREIRLIFQEMIDVDIEDYNKKLRNLNISKKARAAGENNVLIIKQIPIKDFYIGKLKVSGRLLMGKCPFHSDNRASFFIYPTNTWYCFGCSIGGDIIDYVRKRDNCDFKQALETLKK